jgi:hypothetical protein
MKVPARLAKLLSSLKERGPVCRAGSEWRTRCPAHADTDPSLYIRNVSESGNILVRCSAGCSAEAIMQRLGLGMSDLFHDDDTEVEIDNNSAVKCNSLDTPGVHDSGGLVHAGSFPCSPTSIPATDLNHKVYSRLLGLLSLSDRHRKDLRRRGLNDDQVDYLGYRSLEKFAVRQAIGQLKSEFDEESLFRVPGFRPSRGTVHFADTEGLLIPVRDLFGKIVALKVRVDDADDGAKYRWISSGNSGPSPGSPPHVPLGTPGQAPTVRLTEGEIKADVCSQLWEIPTLGVSGVANWPSCMPLLVAMQVQQVYLAFDADAFAKPGVAQHLLDCATGLRNAEYELRLERWEPEDGKGLDDLLAAGKKPEVVHGERLAEVLDELRQVATTRHYDDDDEQCWVPRHPEDEVAPFPLDCLPQPVQVYVTETATAIGCPVDFVALSAITVASAAIGNSRRLKIRRGYEEGCRIFAALVGASGDGKTPARNTACRPVYEEQKRLHAQYQARYEQYVAELETYELAKKAALKAKGHTMPIPEKPVKPVMAHAYVENTTIEALARIMAQNPRGTLVIRDELTALVNSLNSYRAGRGDDREFFLSVWSGAPFKADRLKDEEQPRFVPHPFLSIIGAIPPSQLPVLDAGNNGEDGFVHRILYCFPRRMTSRSWSWHGLSPQTETLWENVVHRLYALEMDQDEHGGPTPRVLNLAPEARPLWEQWYNAHVAEAETADLDEMLKSFWPKCVAYAARLSLIIHLLRATCGEQVGEDVDAESLRRGLKLVRYFQSHTRAVYAHLRLPKKGSQIHRAIAWVRQRGGECNPTALARHNVGGVCGKQQALELMKDMAD